MKRTDGHRPHPNIPERSIPPENRSFAQPRIGSERSFGIQVGAIFAIIGLWPLAAGGPVRLWALILAAFLLLAAAFAPEWLRPVNRLWFRFGQLLGRIVNPIVMGFVYFLIFTPIALVLRLFGKDVLRLKRDASVVELLDRARAPRVQRRSRCATSSRSRRMSFLIEFVALRARAQEILADADHLLTMVLFGGLVDPDQGQRGRAVHLHAVLDAGLMRILGISAFYHDSAAALVRDGEIVAAAQEERFTRKKHDAGFPRNAIDYCLARGGLRARRARSRRVLRQAVPQVRAAARNLSGVRAARASARSRMAMPIWLREKLFQKALLRDELLADLRAEFDAREKLLFSRASFQPRGERLLSLAVRGGRRS